MTGTALTHPLVRNMQRLYIYPLRLLTTYTNRILFA